jgi:hypothetical protein
MPVLTLSQTKWMQGARAQRVEYLLLHSFHAKKFIVPDKFARNKEVNSAKRKMNADTEGANAADGVTDPSVDDVVHHGDQGKARKGPSYAGGLVLEPKKGLYDKYILLLDFNSLYPSIIQVIVLFRRFCNFGLFAMSQLLNDVLYSLLALFSFSQRNSISASLLLNGLLMAIFLTCQLQRLLVFCLRYLAYRCALFLSGVLGYWVTY